MNDVILADRDRNLAMLAHLSGLAGSLTLGAGLVFPFILWMVLKDRPEVRRIALQALLLNLAVAVATVVVVLLAFTIILIPLAWVIGILTTPVAVVLPLVGAFKAYEGELYRYPLIGAIV